MTYSGMMAEVSCINEIKKIKLENNKLKKIIDILESEILIKDYEIKTLQGRLTNAKKTKIT